MQSLQNIIKKLKYIIGLLIFFLALIGGHYFLNTNKSKVTDSEKANEKPDLSNKPVTVLLIHNTGTMMGRGDAMGDTIWFDVQDCIIDFVKNIPLNTVVVVFEFDHSLYEPGVFYLSSNEHKQKAINHIRGIIPFAGFPAAINNVLYSAMDFLSKNYPENNKSIYLITNRVDSSSSIGFEKVIQSLESLQGEKNHLYYIDLWNRARHDVFQEAKINPHFSLLQDCSEINE